VVLLAELNFGPKNRFQSRFGGFFEERDVAESCAIADDRTLKTQLLRPLNNAADGAEALPESVFGAG
jgi:hypothetical protein